MAQRLAAFDTEVLLAVEAGAGDCEGAYQLLHGAGFLFHATPITLQELETLSEDHSREYAQAMAENLLMPNALSSLGILSTPLTQTQSDVTEIHAQSLMEKGLLDGANHADADDLRALIEAAYVDCVLFITCNEDILSRRDDLTLALIKICGMRAIAIVAPSEILKISDGH